MSRSTGATSVGEWRPSGYTNVQRHCEAITVIVNAGWVAAASTRSSLRTASVASIAASTTNTPT